MSTPPTPVILLTGASRGTGLAIARYLLTASLARVVGVARSVAPLTHLHAQFPTDFEGVCGDVTDPLVRERAVSRALDRFGRVDAVVINHGVLDAVKGVAEADLEEWRRVMEVNFFAAVGIVKGVLDEVRRRKGRVVFVSSGAAVSGYHGWGAYGASKAALNHLNVTIAMEEPDVTSVAVRPGVIDTQMQQDIREKHRDGMGDSHERFLELKESGKLLRPEQPGHVIARLALRADKSLSGQFLNWNAEQLAAYQD